MGVKDKTRGIYDKYIVNRTDGRDGIGDKHDCCDYFVLDLTHDKHAIPALKAYAESCEEEYPNLHNDLVIKIDDMLCRGTCGICGKLIAEQPVVEDVEAGTCCASHF